ncbi:E3 SUMO-protein ligase ZBED1-like [Prorops nasuta]
MRFHLERAHPTLKMGVNCTSAKRSALVLEDDDPSSNPDDPDSANSIGTATSMSTSSTTLLSAYYALEETEGSTSKQPRIDLTLRNQTSFQDGGKKALEITSNLLFMIAKDNMSFSTVEKEGFTTFVKTIAPLYKIPCRATITRLMEEKYQVLSSNIKSLLSNTKYMSLTTDIWTDPLNVKSFLGLTAHFIHEDKHKTVTIGVTELCDRHSSNNIQMWLLDVTEKWKIKQESVVTVVCDNGANIKKAVKDVFGVNKQLSCFAHTLNLIPAKIIESDDVHVIFKKIKAIVTFFKKSVAAMDSLRAVSSLKLIQSIDTRWNSAHDMIIRFIELSDKIASILLNLPTAPMMITSTELQTAKEFVDLLKPFKDATKIISGEFYMTASKSLPIVSTLKETLSQLIPITEVGNKMKQLLLEQFELRFQNIEEEKILAMATILDPRFKSIHFNNETACSNIISDINMILNIEVAKEIENVNVQSINLNNTSFWSYHEALIHEIKSKERTTFNSSQMPEDFRFYLSQPPIDIKECPIQFWKSNNSKLSELGRKYLTVVASSVPCERLFSKAGRIITESRNRLSAEHLQQLIFLGSLSIQDWMFLL